MHCNKNLLISGYRFFCNSCEYGTDKKSSYKDHLSSKKHNTHKNTNEPQIEKFKCNTCDRKYKDNSGLWRHKKICKPINKEIDSNNEPTDKELILLLLKQHTKLMEQNSELLEVIKNGINNTTISHNTNSLNKTFNLQFFLNETCKDAMNIMDFVDSIKLQLTDLEKVGQIGYVEGISSIITTNLKALDVTQRPIHCTDKKRETLYIKDEDKWEKENEEKNKIKKVIKKVANKNIMLLQKFKEAHPDCNRASSKYSDQYNKIIIESMGGSGDNDTEKEEKIIKNISNVTTIDKAN